MSTVTSGAPQRQTWTMADGSARFSGISKKWGKRIITFFAGVILTFISAAISTMQATRL